MIHPSLSKSTIGVIGSGAMGSGIAQVAATVGHTVFLYDNNKSVLDKASINLNQTLKLALEMPHPIGCLPEKFFLSRQYRQR